MNSAFVQDRQRATLGSPQGSTHPSASIYPYTSSTASTIPTGFNVGAGQALNDSLAQTRPQYQPGYLLSLAQSQATPVTSGRHEEPLLIPIRAKMSSAYPRNAPSDFGSESIFESTSKKRQREVALDEDGPPTSSVVDLMSEIHADSHKQFRVNSNRSVLAQKSSVMPNSPPAAPYRTLYIIVFGYPPSRYTSTVTYFQSLAEGETTEPEIHSDVENAFRIGYKQPWEAARAWRRNGEIISGEGGGRWMIGVKWMDPTAAEQVLGSGIRVASQGGAAEAPFSSVQEAMEVVYDPTHSQLQRVDTSQPESAASIGTPIKLVPSTSAFRKATPNPTNKDGSLQVHGGPSNSPAKSKGMLGQVSNLIFGW